MVATSTSHRKTRLKPDCQGLKQIYAMVVFFPWLTTKVLCPSILPYCGWAKTPAPLGNHLDRQLLLFFLCTLPQKPATVTEKKQQLGYLGMIKLLFVGIYRGIIMPGFLNGGAKWISSIHGMSQRNSLSEYFSIRTSPDLPKRKKKWLGPKWPG